ncbi:L-lactate permease [Saccharopolyspora erythraea]|uniref:L-lactate permease n=1 Tax=Saccharopolyspora erythraea TaxID=1836 RepID=UPI001BA58ADA|nr:L-lactate permease [Saccharopolyspora erythraea]QUH06065.1 L-lactate permease [Saccharopolyspora erythraea]
MQVYEQDYAPLWGSLGWSALFAALPLLTLFALLGGLRWKAWKASLVALAVASAVALAVYGMPFGQAVLAGTEGAAFGFMPILWIVLNAIWIYKLTELTGWDAVLRRAFGTLSDDHRVQAVIIAFCFGALLEALAGFGTPVAVTAAMLIALGLQPIKAAAVALVANTAPVAFGAIGVPITTLGEITGLDAAEVGAVVGRQTPVLAAVVPLVLVFMVDGRRGLRQTWPVALATGLAFGVAQFVSANYISYQIADIVAAFAGALAAIVVLRAWKPQKQTVPVSSGGGWDPADGEPAGERPSRGSALLAFAPYLIVVVLFAITTSGPVSDWLSEHATWKWQWPGLHVVDSSGEALSAITFKFELLNGGTVLLLVGVLTALLYRVAPMRALRAYGATFAQFRWTILTVMAVLALAYVMNLSGQTITLGLFLAQAGAMFALLSPVVGWLGVAVTGSDTSANSLFGLLQLTAAQQTGLSAQLLAAGNSSGGVLGKMISPQNLAIAAAVVGLEGREGELFRRVVGWSLALLALICALVYLQSTPVLGWMVS